MRLHSWRGGGRLMKLVAGFVAIVAVVFGAMSRPAVGEPAEPAPAMKLASPGMKFDGARTCRGTKCHDKAGDEAPPKERDHEYNIWSAHDKHAKAFEALSKPESAEIGKKMATPIADVTKSEACLSCHAQNVPENLRGQKFSIKEGNTCTSCHGPSEKWLEPHADKGWTDKQRAAIPDHEALLKQWGLYDTKALLARAELCT